MSNAFTDLMVARRIEKLKTELAAASTGIDRGERFVSKKNYRSGDFVAGIAGDSTGNSPNEHMDLFAAAVAAADPKLRVEIPHWNDSTQSYDAPTVVQAGVAEATGTVFLDTFSRTAADLYGTTPDIGPEWGRDGTNAAGDWSIDGSKLVRTSDTTTSGMMASSGVLGDQTVSLTGSISTTTTGTSRLFRVYFHYVGAVDHLFAQVNVTSTGVAQLQLFKRIGNVSTQLGTSVNGLLTTNLANQPFTLSMTKNGLNVSATLNGGTASGTLTQSDSTLLGTSSTAGFGAGVMAGDWLDNFKIELLGNPAPPRKFTLYNASVSGSTLTYQQTRLAAMFPVPLDVLFVSSCHNYGSKTSAQYQADLDTFMATFRAVQPDAGIVIMSQNPQKAPANNRAAHLARLASLPSYAARRGYGYIPVIEKFLAQPDGGVTLINSDGVHPTTGAGSGSELWRDATVSYFAVLTSNVGPAGPAGSVGPAGPAGPGLSAIPNLSGHWALMNPGKTQARTDHYPGYLYLMPVLLPAAMNVTAVVFNVTSAAAGASMALAVYTQPTAGNFVRLLNWGTVSCATTGEKQVNGSVTLPAGIVYFAWLPLGASVQVTVTDAAPMVPGPFPVGAQNTGFTNPAMGWILGTGLTAAPAEFTNTAGMNQDTLNLRLAVKLA